MPQQVAVAFPTTGNKCLTACAMTSFKWAGLQYGGECWCGSSEPSSSLLIAPERCAKACADSTTACGGSLAMLVYMNPDAAVVAKPSLIVVSSYQDWTLSGCYVDSSTSRVLSKTTSLSGSVTPESCMTSCRASGYSTAGIEYSTECFCGYGNVLPSSAGAAVPTSDCNMPCQGDITKACGGGNRIQLYTSSKIQSNLNTYTSIPSAAWRYLTCWGEPQPHSSNNRGLCGCREPCWYNRGMSQQGRNTWPQILWNRVRRRMLLLFDSRARWANSRKLLPTALHGGLVRVLRRIVGDELLHHRSDIDIHKILKHSGFIHIRGWGWQTQLPSTQGTYTHTYTRLFDHLAQVLFLFNV